AIIRAGVAVVASQAPEAMAVLLRRATEVGVPLLVSGRDLSVTVEHRDLDGQRISCAGPGWSVAHLRLGMLGSFQPENALLAVASSDRRGADPAALRAAVPPAVPRVELAASPVEALALAGRSPKSPVVCVAGSLSLIGDVWRHLAGSDDPCPVEVDIMGSLF